MASSKPILCGPCHKGEVTTKADIWCYNCDEGLCSTCLSHHKRSKGTCDHKTFDIKSYKSSIQTIKTECDKHGKQLNLYCPSHLMPCCDECISTVHSKCTEIKSLAGVVDKTKIEKSKETVETDIHSILKSKVQIESREQSNINSMTMNIETGIEINMEKRISDMICLMDGRVIVVEEKDEVNLLTSDGNLQTKLPISGKAWSVTQINQNTIAITYSLKKTIKIFNMENETITNFIKLDKHCFGLSSSDDSLVVGLEIREIRIIDLEGNTLKSIQVECKSLLSNLVYCNDRVIYSDYFGKAVYCYDGSGKQIWQHTQNVSGPKGLCTDTYGNIIVANYGSTRIIVISKDGQESKELISNLKDGRVDGCICFKHNESSGFIFIDKHDDKYLTKFNLSYQ